MAVKCGCVTTSSSSDEGTSSVYTNKFVFVCVMLMNDAAATHQTDAAL
jgi:hypothetical protein